MRQGKSCLRSKNVGYMEKLNLIPFALRKHSNGKFYIALNTHYVFYYYDTLGIPVEVIERWANKYYPREKSKYIRLFNYLFYKGIFE